MITVYKMEYKHISDDKSNIEMVRYSSEYREKFKSIYNECYHKMRKALGIQPYDFIQDDSFFESNMDNVYLLLDKEVIIGSVTLKGDEIDDLIVNSKYQGKGFGRKILLWALEHIKTEKIILHVAAWNEQAINLYKNTGFEIIETITINN